MTMPPHVSKLPFRAFQSQSSPNLSICYQCARQQTQRSFSTTPRHATRQRRAMFSWLNGPGAAFRHPLPGSTNYLNAYDAAGRLLRATDRQRKSDKNGDGDEDDAAKADYPSLEKNIQGERVIPRETLDDLMPFPLNRQFRSEPVLSEELKDEIFRQWKIDKKTVRRISSDLQVEMRRVGAVLRLKSVEEDWVTQVCQIPAFTVLSTLGEHPMQ